MSQSIKSVSAFGTFLLGMGMTCLRREEPANAMGYRLIEYGGTAFRVRLVWEKGFWDARIAGTSTASDAWYDVRLLTYLFGGRKEPEMQFDEQLDYVKTHWADIGQAFGPDRRINTHVRLDAAKMDRARKVFMIWPSAVQDLEVFLRGSGLACVERKEAQVLYGAMSVKYANSMAAVRISSTNGWHIDFAGITANPNQWYPFTAIRKLLQWPNDRQLSYNEMFDFIKDNWHRIIEAFGQENIAHTIERLGEIESAQGDKV